MARVYNFSAGPAVLPEEVLKEAAEEKNAEKKEEKEHFPLSEQYPLQAAIFPSRFPRRRCVSSRYSGDSIQRWHTSAISRRSTG